MVLEWLFLICGQGVKCAILIRIFLCSSTSLFRLYKWNPTTQVKSIQALLKVQHDFHCKGKIYSFCQKNFILFCLLLACTLFYNGPMADNGHKHNNFILIRQIHNLRPTNNFYAAHIRFLKHNILFEEKKK